MDCCVSRGARPERLCPDNPGSACVDCLDRAGSVSSERLAGRIRVLNGFGDSYDSSTVYGTASSVRQCSSCVIL